MATKFLSVDVLLVDDVLLALSVGQQVFVGAGDDEGHCPACSFAAFCASPSRDIFSLPVPFLLVGAVDPGSACEVEPVRVLGLFLLELDDLVLLAFRSAVWSERYGLVEERGVERQSLGLLNFHIP